MKCIAVSVVALLVMVNVSAAKQDSIMIVVERMVNKEVSSIVTVQDYERVEKKLRSDKYYDELFDFMIKNSKVATNSNYYDKRIEYLEFLRKITEENKIMRKLKVKFKK